MRPLVSLPLPAAAALAAAAGCASPDGQPVGPEPVVLSARSNEVWTPRLSALRQAVEEREDALARQILSAILRSEPGAEVRELALGFDRILDGRVVVDALDVTLLARSHPASAYHYELILTAEHGFEQQVVLLAPPPSLRRTVTSLDPSGAESTRLLTRVVTELATLRVPPGEPIEVFLGIYVAPIEGALGLRDEWVLSQLSGEVLVGDRRLPAAEPPGAKLVQWFRAPFLPTDPVEPAELARYAHQPEIVTAALIERAVRIEPSRHHEALIALAPVVEGQFDERVLALTPALRWLAGVREAAPDARSWRVILARMAVEEASRAVDRDGLDLPLEVLQ